MADDPLTLVALDIETTGFSADDRVTVVGFALPMGCRVFCLVDDPSQESGLEATAQQRVDRQIDTHVTLSTHETEHALLEAVGDFVAERFRGDDVLIVAYNGECWRSGFDVPFLRTRHALQDIRWPFADLPYADLLPIIRDLFNTQTEDDDHNDLVGAYSVLIGDGLTELDPFEESSEAVAAFRDEDYEALIMHNVADILRTVALGRLAQAYCSRSDFDLKSMTPTRVA